MASRKQSFQCFDTTTDDPPLKPPFHHGHCSARSFRGSSGSTRLEPLEDRGCYLCDDHQQAKVMASEASGACSNPWCSFQTYPHAQQNTNRRPVRPEEAPGQSKDHHHHHHRHSRKIVLVKNSDPSVRRTIVLHRRSLRSMALFMDEVSELMQCLIRKLYTLQGHKIDSVHSLLQCPNILVCVGREPFHPLLLDSFRKNSYDKLPRLNIKSCSSVCSDEKGAKKNVNFGLETKRSAIHPRSDSSNRSGFEKLFPNRLNSLPPGHRGDCPHSGENMDDDIEKRVLVNQDGSLSMEMKVRFRLLHNETLHWSTEVKKSKSSFNESHVVPDDACFLSHGSAESCSEADSLSAGEADETYSTKYYQRHFEQPHCQHCCAHCKEYDIWKNPEPPSQRSVRRIRSSSSSASSRRIVCKKASTDSMRTMSSEEYTEHVVEKATRIQQTIGQQGDTTIEQCTINHCCSRSEVRSMSPKTKSTSAIEDKRENTHASDNDENRPDVISSNLPKDQLNVKITHPVEEDERSVSVVSCSSQILASLKEDHDDEDVDLPLSISRASCGQQEDEERKDAEQNSSCTSCKSPAYLSPRPPSKASSSGQSKISRKFASPQVGDEEVRTEASTSPKALIGPKINECVVSKDIATVGASESNEQLEDVAVQDTETEERALSAMSDKLNNSTKSMSELSAPYENGNAPENTEVNDEIVEERSSSAISGKSNKTNVSEVHDGRAHSVMSTKTDKSRNTEISGNVSEEQTFEARTSSAMSVKSNTSVRSKPSENSFDDLAKSQVNVEERAVSAVSSKSNISVKSSQSKEPQPAPVWTSEERIEEKASSVESGTLNKSGIEDLTSDDQTEERVHSSISIKSNISARSKMSIELSEFEDDEQGRAPSSVSIKSFVSQMSMSDISEAASLQEGGECLNSLNTSVKLNAPEAGTQVELPGERSPSCVSSISNISRRSRASKLSEADQDEAQEKEDVQERASSTISVKSTASARSRKSKKTPTPGLGEEMKERAPSGMSIKTNVSLKSNKSKIEEEETENRASSALSVQSEVSTLSKKSNLSDREQLEERETSAISARSNVSVKSKMSEVAGDDDRSSAVSHTSETSNECITAPKKSSKRTEKSPDKEERAPSTLSTKSNNSSKSKKSKVSDMTADIMAENRDDLRSSSVLSSKSNISAKSVKTIVTEKDQTDERPQSAFSAQSSQSEVTISDGVEVAEERALSAMSSKTNASERLEESNNLISTLPRGSEHQTEERAQSALSARSNVSTRSNKSKISVVLTELVDADQEEERALSANSNMSTKSKKSSVSSINVKTDNKEKGDRVSSAMSGRSDISTKTSISAKSTASKVSEVQAEEPDSKDQEEERASSVLSVKSNISVKSKMSKASETDINTDKKEKGDRVPSALSGRSDISTKSSISAESTASKVSEVQAEEPDSKDQEEEDRASSALSARSNVSTRFNKSRISDVSTELIDANDQEEERALSALSAKSNVSAKSKKSSASSINVKTDNKEKGDRVSSAMSGRSDISTKTSISAKSTASKVLEVQAEEPDSKVQEEERASSALSAKSNISAKSKMSKASETDINTDKKEKGDRVPSALSGRSDISTKSSISAESTASKVSEVQAEEPDSKDQEEEDRASSALSARSNVSTRFNKSRISDVLTELIDANDQEEERALSALSAKSNVSAKSKKSSASSINVKTDNKEKGDRVSSAMSGRSDISTKTSISAKSTASKVLEVQAEEPDSKVQEEERASSALSAKSNISAKSKMSNASATDINTDNKEKRDRVPSALSGRSDISTKSSISRKSKASKVSEVQAKETDDDDDDENKEKAPSVSKSRISVRSNKSKLSEEEEVHNPDRPSSAISIMSEATPDENEISNEGEIQERAPRSRTSEVSEIIIDEPDEQEVERAPSSRSLKSDVSERSGSEDPVNEDKQKEARTESALSSISHVSARSNKSEDSELISNLQQRAPSTASVTSKTSARSKRSNISGLALKETGNMDREDIRSSSAMSAKSCASEKSKYSERTAEEDGEANKVIEGTTGSLSEKSTLSTTSDATVKSSVVATKSNASRKSLFSEAEEPISEGQEHTATNTVDMELNRCDSPVSDQSKVSQSEVSNKYVCGAINSSSNQMASPEKDSEHEEVPESPFSKKSAKSKISSVSSTSERVLTPTSTSVSIGIVEDHDAVEEIDEGAVSMTSGTSASSNTKICSRSNQCLSESPVRITSKITQIPEERPQSFASAKSSVSSKSKTKCSHCGSTFSRDTNQDIDDVASNKSSKTKNLNTSSEGKPSDNGPASQSSLTEEIRPLSKASAMSTHTEITGQEKTESPDVTHESQSVCSKCSSSQEKRQISSASAISDSEKSKTKEGNTDRPKSDISSSSSHLKVHGQKKDVKTTVVNGRNNKLSTKSAQKIEDNTPRCHSATLSVTSGNQLSPIPPKSPKKSKKPVILLGISNDSTLSQNVPAPDPREEHTDHLNAAAEKSKSCRSDTNVSDVKSEKSSKCRKRIGSDSSCHKKMDEDMSELSPSCLPNASPTEVVNEWLRKIPLDTALCDFDNEFHDNFDSIEPHCTSHMPSGDEKEHESLQCDVTKLETQREMEDANGENAEAAIDKKSPEVAEGDHSQRGDKLKMFDSSVLVMKVLLSPKLDRCNSLPEVSPVYGRKLSTSAQGLLDCLANLQLLDFGSSDEDVKKEKYQELMSMLKSLWLCDPKDSEKTSEERNKHLDKELKARSSSGVDVNSGSTGSGKSSVNDAIQVQTNTECEGLDILTKVQEVDETVEEEASETSVSKYNSATPDIASQPQWTPETTDTVQEKLKDDVQGSDETIRNNDSPRELIETPLSSNKSSGNNNNKETESDHQEDTSSGSATTQHRVQLSKRLSQDPDPLWVLNLLNKLEKQFMTNYVDAMAEFKVRWNLDDNEQLDTMIGELQDEVSRRIQLSINRELRKIQGRAGRPRPPKETISRDSTIQTEQRRRRLKVMRNQSIDPQPAKSDDDNTMTGTDFSDQRSDDEYCPCDTCLKKKMANSKHVLPAEMLNSAPVMMDFDLRRILQIKKSSPTNENIGGIASESMASKIEGENVGLQAVKEEDEGACKEEVADIEIPASSAEEVKEEYEEQESETGEEEDNASSTYIEDSSVQSITFKHLRKDVDEVAEMSDNTITAQHKAAEQDEEQKKNDERDSDLMSVKESASSSKFNDELDKDVANDDISEFDDIMQAEATEEHTEEEPEEHDETAYNETAKEGQNAKIESIEEGETTDEETVGQTAAEEDDIAGNEAAEDGTEITCNTEEEVIIAESKTAEDGQIAEAVTTDKSDDKTAEEGVDSEGETVEEVEKAEDKTSEDGQTAEAETAGGDEKTEDETAEDGEKSDNNESEENGQTAGEDEITEDETAEEGEISANNKSVEDEQTAGEDEITDGEAAEEGETAAKNKSVEEEQSAGEDEITEGAEDGDISANNASVEEEQTGGEDEITEDETAEDGQTVAKNESVKDGQTSEDESAEEDETAAKDESVEDEQSAGDDEIAENETAKEGETAAKNESVEEEQTFGEDEIAEDETAEENETSANNESVEDDQTAGEDEITGDETVEDGETVTKNESVKDGQTAEVESAEECETSANNESVEDEQTAGEDEITGDETAEYGETAAENESVEDEETTGEDETAEDGENESVKDEQTAGDESAEEGETSANNESVEDGQTGGEDEITGDETAEYGETAAENESVEDEQTTGEGEIADDETAEDGETSANNESVKDAEDEIVEDANTGHGQTAEKSEIANDDTVEEHEMGENESAEAETETAGETDTGDENTANEGTSEAETEISKEKAIFEYGTTAEGKNGQLELADLKQTPDHEMNGEETDKSQSDAEEDKESVHFEAAEEGDILSNLEDTACLEVLTNVEVVEDETSLMNKGDIVLDSVEDKGEESEKEDNDGDVKLIANKCGLVANNGESAEAGDEAEDDTEPDMETDEEERVGNAPAFQTELESKQINDHLDEATSFNDLVKHNSESEDGADADGEDSETEEQSQVVEFSSESEGKSQKKTAYKTFKALVHTLKFLKLSAATQPERREEDNEHEAEDKETPELGSDDAEEPSCLGKDEVEELNGKEEGKLSDITEDTAEEEDQTNETHDNSKDSEWESSENALQKQMTKSSLESQPGSFEEVHEELTKNKKGLNYLQANS